MSDRLTWFELLRGYYMDGVADGGNEDSAAVAIFRQWVIEDGLDPDGDSPVARPA